MGFDGAELKRRKERAERIAKKINKQNQETSAPKVAGETISERLNNMPPEQRDLAVKTFLFIGLLTVLLCWWGWHKLTTPDEPSREHAASITQNLRPTPTQAQAQPARSGSISRDLGPQNISFGSQKQAQSLLQFIDEWPGKNEYVISYTTDADKVSLICNFQHETLVRRHDYHSGKSSLELWNRYILERLQNGAGGGSLNDTPEGKLVSNRQTVSR
jgi:hypothetical protein